MVLGKIIFSRGLMKGSQYEVWYSRNLLTFLRRKLLNIVPKNGVSAFIYLPKETLIVLMVDGKMSYRMVKSMEVLKPVMMISSWRRIDASSLGAPPCRAAHSLNLAPDVAPCQLMLLLLTPLLWPPFAGEAVPYQWWSVVIVLSIFSHILATTSTTMLFATQSNT